MADSAPYRPARGPVEERAPLGFDAFEMNDAYAMLQQWRWPNGKPECPHCGHDQFWYLAERRRFKCKAHACRKQFSITSGTMLHSPKCGAAKLIRAIRALHDNPEASAAEIMRVTGMSYRGAYYLAERLRLSGG